MAEVICEMDEKALVREYLAEQGLTGGYGILYLGELCGWRADLREADGWRPGCIAVDEDGNRWGAMGGNDDDGAERWERIG